jgi:hypothetical protein
VFLNHKLPSHRIIRTVVTKTTLLSSTVHSNMHILLCCCSRCWNHICVSILCNARLLHGFDYYMKFEQFPIVKGIMWEVLKQYSANLSQDIRFTGWWFYLWIHVHFNYFMWKGTRNIEFRSNNLRCLPPHTLWQKNVDSDDQHDEAYSETRPGAWLVWYYLMGSQIKWSPCISVNCANIPSVCALEHLN